MKTRFPQLRQLYKARLVFRFCVFAFTIVMYLFYPQTFNVMNGFSFFHKLSWLHVLWLVWIVDMIWQLVPREGFLSLGSLKQFKEFYKPIRKIIDLKKLSPILNKNRLDSLKVLVIWTLLVAGIGTLWAEKILKEKELLLISVVFYVLDLVFVLFWCPFRVWILKNRCCTTCRIFNWDHLMMFSPLIFIPGFYSYSLFSLSIIVFLAWEISFILHPERFCEETNAALQCRNCTDRLCGNMNIILK